MDPKPTEAATASEEAIVRRIHDAVMEQRLPPGTKLSEAALCEAFGVQRGRIRRSLLLLATRKIVDLHPNRGAFVARPTAEDAHDIFEARRAVEDAVARLAAARTNASGLQRLRSHLDAESAAHATRNRRRAIRLSGEFHVLLAELAENVVLHDMVRELVARTSLIIALYGGTETDSCRAAEHRELLDALGDRDADRAAGVMRQHLVEIECQIDVARGGTDGVDLVQLFRGDRGVIG